MSRYNWVTAYSPISARQSRFEEPEGHWLEQQQRHEWAMKQIDAGMGLSELAAITAETWGCSRRNARDVVSAAHKDWLDAAYRSEEIDQRELLFQ